MPFCAQCGEGRHEGVLSSGAGLGAPKRGGGPPEASWSGPGRPRLRQSRAEGPGQVPKAQAQQCHQPPHTQHGHLGGCSLGALVGSAWVWAEALAWKATGRTSVVLSPSDPPGRTFISASNRRPGGVRSRPQARDGRGPTWCGRRGWLGSAHWVPGPAQPSLNFSPASLGLGSSPPSESSLQGQQNPAVAVPHHWAQGALSSELAHSLPPSSGVSPSRLGEGAAET